MGFHWLSLVGGRLGVGRVQILVQQAVTGWTCTLAQAREQQKGREKKRQEAEAKRKAAKVSCPKFAEFVCRPSISLLNEVS